MEITISLLNLLSRCYNGRNKTINVFLLLLSHTDIVVGMLMMILIIIIIIVDYMYMWTLQKREAYGAQVQNG